ncbi:MAG: MBL fold metallo-hydrolase [Woeseiaceae bacterium]|jgi:glyoxylase-like metal-dependent hydrolase (beta-lactamase superfamily II)
MPIEYEFETRPAHGDVNAVVDGIRWLRMPLPMALEHINLWLLDDERGFAIVDTGVCIESNREVWARTFSGPMRGRPVTRVIVTHLHPDHSGCAGWLTEQHDVELWMTREEYLLCRILISDTGRDAPAAGSQFYRGAGFSDEALTRYQQRFGMFGRVVAPLPESYRRIVDRERLSIGGNDWEIVVGRGHSPEHACLFDAERNIVISGDQLLPTISSNVSVYPTEPHANPLRDWLESLAAIKIRLPEDVLVLPAHGKPFRGAHARLDALILEHTTGLGRLLELCSEPRRAIDVFPALFKGRISDGNLIMAAGESIAHLNYLVAEGSLDVESRNGVLWYRRN